MIIYGSRMYGAKNRIDGYGVCDHCGYYTQNKSYDGRKWAHVYFIPIFPLGGHVRVLRECGKCGMGSHMPVAAVAEVYGQLESLMQLAVAAASDGRHVVTPPGSQDEVHTGPLLTEAIVMLHGTGHGEDIPGVLELLKHDNAEYEHHVAASAWSDVRGKPDEARAMMQQAAAKQPDAPYPLVMLARFAARAGDAQGQLNYLQKCNDLLGGRDVTIMLEMIAPLETLQRFDELTALLDRCIAVVPELAHDKKFMKHHKKYAKKAQKMAAKAG